MNNGNSLLVLGDSGVGKTTFILNFLRIVKSLSGQVHLGSINYNELSSKKWINLGKNIGDFQNHILFEI